MSIYCMLPQETTMGFSWHILYITWNVAVLHAQCNRLNDCMYLNVVHSAHFCCIHCLNIFPSLFQCRVMCKDVSAETMYDVLHDTEYRKKWDSNVIETFDIGRLTVNADVGYYSCMLLTCVNVHLQKGISL